MSSKRMIRVKSYILASIMVLGVGAGLNVFNAAQAQAAAWDDRAWRTSGSGEVYSQSYFERQYQYTVGYYYAPFLSGVMPRPNPADINDFAIPGNVDTVDEFIGYLQGSNGAGGNGLIAKWSRAGSAFIVHTMLGRSGDQANAAGGRSVSSADFETLRARMNAARSINWFAANVSTDGINTMSGMTSRNGQVDVMREQQYKSDIAIVIQDSIGNQYKLFRKCANPIGAMTGLSGLSFDLVPTIAVSPDFTSGNSTGSTNARLSPAVTNNGATASNNSIQWRIVTFRLAPLAGIPGGGTNANAPEQHFGNGAVAIASAAGQTFPRNVTNLSASDQPIGDFPIGTRICYALSVQPVTQSYGGWRHSAPDCVVIAKSPKIQVRGGDIRVGNNFIDQTVTAGSNITTSQTVKNR